MTKPSILPDSFLDRVRAGSGGPRTKPVYQYSPSPRTFGGAVVAGAVTGGLGGAALGGVGALPGAVGGALLGGIGVTVQRLVNPKVVRPSEPVPICDGSTQRLASEHPRDRP
jgi:hypothetical protein